MVRLTYIWHDCFLFEDERVAIVFDFWRDPMIGEEGNGSKKEDSLPGFLCGINRDVAHFFPMHFGLGTPEEQMKYQLDAADVENYANPERGEYICLQTPYSCFAIAR